VASVTKTFVVCTPLKVNVFITLATQWHFECHCKALFETPALPVEVTLNSNYPRWNSVCFATYDSSKYCSTKSKLLYDYSQSVSQYVLISSILVRLVTRYYFLSERCCLKFAVLYMSSEEIYTSFQNCEALFETLRRRLLCYHDNHVASRDFVYLD
jgi:hypothetical protein